jgi:hypothetical protein
MKRLPGVFVLMILIQQFPLKAQNYYYYNSKYYDNALVFEVGGSAGVMNSLTDLGGKKGVGKKFVKDLRWKTARPSFGFYLAADYQNKIVARLEGTFGQVCGFDSILKSVAASTYGRYERNLSFKSPITEFQLGLEIHPLYFLKYDEDKTPPPISPYGVIGVGYYHFNPQAELNGQWYDLQPLHTEGQGFPEYPDRKVYKLSQINLSAGLGLKYEVSSTVNARLEFVHRFLFTDYLDDVSTDYIDPSLFAKYLPANQAAIAQQLYYRKKELNPGDITNVGDQRGDPTQNDSFFTIQLKVGVVFGRQRR